MSWLTSSWTDPGVTAGKAVLMYATEVVGLRLGERRTLAQWTAIDFAAVVAIVAIVAIVGRTAIASNQSYAIGAVALVSLPMLHRLTSLARFQSIFGRLTDHRVRVLVIDGQLRRDQLRLCGLTDDDLLAQLRQHGISTCTTCGTCCTKRSVDSPSSQHATTIPPPGDLIDAGLQSSAGSGRDQRRLQR